MASSQYRLRLRVPIIAWLGLSVVCALIGPIGHSQVKFPQPPITRKWGIILHIDGPAVVSSPTFPINYTIYNNTEEPANGTITAYFAGAKLGSTKLNNLPQGKSQTGKFPAAVHDDGTYTALLIYCDQPYTVTGIKGPITICKYNARDVLDIVATNIIP